MSFLNVYDQNRQKTAVLQNAFGITEEQQLNNIYSLTFSLPGADEKLRLCQPFHYFRYGDGELYRMVKNPKQRSDISIDTIICEHVIATLCDNVMFGYHTFGGAGTHTVDVLTYILSKQTVKNWVLGECDFDFAYEYNWEQENLLNALYSVPKVFTDPYKWEFNTQVYPWRVSLKRIDTAQHPDYYIRAKLNLVSDSAELDYTNVCTRLYPLGYGEGINQLNIKDVNDGIPYLDAPASVIARYGIKEKVLVDRQFEDAETLKSYAQSVLDAMQEPAVTRRFNVVDLYPITTQDIDNAEVGKICKLTEDGTITYVTRTTRVLDEAGNLQIDLSTKPTDIASAIADLADRVRIEAVYAQGATQLYQHSKDANATPDKGMVLSLYFPSEMKQINKVLLKLKLNKFRSYSQTTESSSQVATTTQPNAAEVTTALPSGQGEVVATSGPSSANTTRNGGAGSDIVTSSTPLEKNTEYAYPDVSNLGHFHRWYHSGHTHTIDKSKFNHTHEMPHTHEVHVPVTAHTHTVPLSSHQHKVTIPGHTHAIKAGIFESGSPSSFKIIVNGTEVARIDSISYNDDITNWLLGSDGLVIRDRWIDMEIVPNDNAYVIASVFVQGFVQSRGGGNY